MHQLRRLRCRLPFGAISDVSMMTGVIDALQDDKREVVALLAPSIEGQFGAATLPQIKEAVRRLGFDDVYEVALGADMVAVNEAEELLENKAAGKATTSSCCPAFVSMVRKHFPELMAFVSTTVSPHGGGGAVCPHEKTRGYDGVRRSLYRQKKRGHGQLYQGLDYALTFEELYAMMCAKEIEPAGEEAGEEEATRYGKGFALSGGVTKAVEQVLAEQGDAPEIKALPCNGGGGMPQGPDAPQSGTAFRGFHRGDVLCGRLYGGGRPI